MSGKRQHFIPQFLQRGFTVSDDAANAWVFHKERPPLNTNTKNIALEGQFYSQDGDTSVDDAITEDEAGLAKFVEELRGAADGDGVEPQRAARLIAHMLIRTRHVRENFRRMTGGLVTGLYAALSDPEKLVAVFTRHFEDDENLIRALRRSLTMAFADRPPEQLNRLLGEAATRGALREARAVLPQLFAAGAVEIATALKAEGDLAQSLLKDAMKSGHLKALKRFGTGSAREEAFTKLKFHVCKCPEGNLILGDSAVVYAIEGARQVAPLNDSTMPMIGVLLPLDSETCLIGELDEPCAVFSNAESVREAIAASSLEFFIAPANTNENRQLVETIGRQAHLLNEAEVVEILEGLSLGGEQQSNA